MHTGPTRGRIGFMTILLAADSWVKLAKPWALGWHPRLASCLPGVCQVSQVAVAESADRKRVLFADEEIGSLRDLQRMLQPMRREGEMIFATSGTMALQILEERPFDVLVTAARLSDLADGSLLAAVAVQHPQMIRIALCERADR